MVTHPYYRSHTHPIDHTLALLVAHQSYWSHTYPSSDTSILKVTIPSYCSHTILLVTHTIYWSHTILPVTHPSYWSHTHPTGHTHIVLVTHPSYWSHTHPICHTLSDWSHTHPTGHTLIILVTYTSYWSHTNPGGGPRVVVSTAAFHARVRGSVPGLGGLKETKLFLPHPRVKVSIVGSLRDREVACSASDRQGSNFESCVWRTVSSQSSHHPQEVLLAQFSLYVHKGGLKPDSFHFIFFFYIPIQLLPHPSYWSHTRRTGHTPILLVTHPSTEWCLIFFRQ